MMNYYQILEVSETADIQEIKAAYKRLAMQFHPDRNPGDREAEEQFKQVNNAYQVLSDPQARTQYDIQISFQQYQQTATYTDSSNNYASSYRNGRYRSREYQSPPSDRQYDFKERKKAERQDFAIALMLIVSMLTIVGLYIGITSYMNMRKADEERAYKESQLAKARMYLQSENYAACLAEVNSLLDTWPTETEYIDFQDRILSDVETKADRAFNDEKYFEALQLYKLLLKNEGTVDKSLKVRVSECYIKQERYNNAIAILKEIVRDYPSDISIYYEIASVYMVQNRYTDALKYLDYAQQLAIRYYENNYGEAYAIVVDPKALSDVHYRVFYSRGKLYYEMEEYEQALKDCTWAAFLRPSRAEVFLLKGNCEFQLRKRAEACKSWATAVDLGSGAAAEKMDGNCGGR